MADCEAKNRPFITCWNYRLNTFYVFVPDCKKWSCAACGHRNSMKWQYRLLGGADYFQSQQGRPLQLITFTSHEKLRNREQCLEVLPKAWAKLGTRMRRKTEDMAYVAIPEFHKDKRVHVHMIATTDLTTRWMKNNARGCGLGHQATAETLESASQALWYVAKYLGKQVSDAAWPQGFRHVRASRNWPRTYEPLPSPYVWERLKWRGVQQRMYEAFQTGFNLDTNNLDVQIEWLAIQDYPRYPTVIPDDYQ